MLCCSIFELTCDLVDLLAYGLISDNAKLVSKVMQNFAEYAVVHMCK